MTQGDVDFSGVSITGEGPVGVSLVRTKEPNVRFEYLNMDHPENCAVNANIVDGIMQITVKNTAPNGFNVDFGEQPKNVVCIYIPNAVYTTFDISLNKIVLHTQDFNAPVHVTSNQAGFSLIDQEISRGVYDIDMISGPLSIEADTILKDITANVDNGPIALCFHKEPANLYLDTENCGPGYVNRPADWSAIYRVGNETPRLILSNNGPTAIEVKTNKFFSSDENEKSLTPAPKELTSKTDVASSDKDLDLKQPDSNTWDDNDFDSGWDKDSDFDWDFWNDEDSDFDWDFWDDEDSGFLWADDDDWDFNWDEQKEKVLMNAYAAYGITQDGKSYYYQGKLVNVFLDQKPDCSFYTLEVNPKGTINIKINRNKDGEMIGVSYMTEKEIKDLLGDMDDSDKEAEYLAPEIIPISLKEVKAGNIIWLGEFTLSEGDKIWYDVFAESGNELQTGFAKPGDECLNTTYCSVQNVRQKDNLLKCTANFTIGSSIKPGTYKLFLRATDDTLKNVKGSISICKKR